MTNELLMANDGNGVGVTPPLNALTQPFPTTILPDARYFKCTSPVGSIHRTDGVRISFAPFGVHETKVKQTIDFLMKEIDNGHPNIFEATQEEISVYRMAKDPRGTIEAEMRSKIEEKTKEQLIKEIMADIDAGTIKPGSVAATVMDQIKIANTEKQLKMPASRLQGIMGSDRLGDNTVTSGK